MSERRRYGPDPSQWVDVHRGDDPRRGCVVVLHGGFWRSRYDATLGGPLAADLALRGWTALNVEYRRVGPGPGGGGGWPETFDDVHAAVELLAVLDGVPPGPVLTLGHSAGGHLAVWAAARHRFSRWRPAEVVVAGAVSQAGVLDLASAERDALGSGAVRDLLGRPVAELAERVDPRAQQPLTVPVRCVHGLADDVVPLSQSRDYVAAARAAGGDASVREVPGDHYAPIDPASAAWAHTVAVLEELSGVA